MLICMSFEFSTLISLSPYNEFLILNAIFEGVDHACSYQENGTLVGTVVNVFNSGANDLLQIALDSSFDMLDKSGKSKSAGTDVSGQLVLVPFVEAIVPDVDMKRREMHITPPKGLLELNLRFDGRSKKERRQLVSHTVVILYY